MKPVQPPLIYRFGPLAAEGSLGVSESLGLRGAYLAEAAALGLPVPAGFTLTVEVCRQLAKGQVPDDVLAAIADGLSHISKVTGAHFGDAANPLLLSVRPSPRHALPGMMEAILNLGLNDQTVEGLARLSNDPHFAFECYRRFIQNFAHVAMGDDPAAFDDIVHLYLDERAYVSGSELKGTDARELITRFKSQVESHGEALPHDVMQQLTQSIVALARAWTAPRAKTHRKIHNIADEDAGLAIIVQAMVFGNRGEESGAGIASARLASTGEAKLNGVWLRQAQGPDRLGRVQALENLDSMAATHAAFAQDLTDALARAEQHFRDFMEIEFTIERGALSVLDVRPQPRTTAAGLAMAVGLADQGVISREEAILRIEPVSLGQMLHSTVDASTKRDVIASGLPASPGAAMGQICFTTEEAEALAKSGEAVILVRPETLPEDIRALHLVEGILTTRGGMTSHAAVIARGMGKPCVAGAGTLRIDTIEETLTGPGFVLKRGDIITIDGTAGQVLRGNVPVMKPSLSGDFAKLLSWSDSMRRMKVRANAETPQDARTARDFGAEGIGLCRTEHMFFDGDRIIAMREMILADRERDRRAALAKLLPMLRDDFVTLFVTMAGLPVTLRLLDPPLHEFLPEGGNELEAVAQSLGVTAAVLRRRVVELKEQNPMLGHRGVRLLLTYPEITEMQARAIFEACAIVANTTGKAPIAEIMVPLVVSRAELDLVKARIASVAAEVEAESGVTLHYFVGTMIELPRAALRADDIALSADFFSFGTNDLTQTTFGISRDDSARFIGEYTSRGILRQDPFITLDIEGVGELIELAVQRGRQAKADIQLGICGEHGGDPDSIAYCEQLQLDYVSCSPFRVPIARLAAAQATLRKKPKIESKSRG
jgi:pyruvate, orthophosphate dikinase